MRRALPGGAGLAFVGALALVPPSAVADQPRAPGTHLVSPYVVYTGQGLALAAAETPTGCDRLYLSRDLATWRPLADRLPRRVRCYFWSSATFVTREVGWLLGRDPGGDATVLLHTTDGARTWRTQPGSSAGSNGGYEQVGFSNARDGWRQQVAIGTSPPYLLQHTSTAGWSWHAVAADGSTGCAFLPDVFASARIGFAANGFGTPPTGTGGFYYPFPWRTLDGGVTWAPEPLGMPPAVGTSIPTLVGAPAFDGARGSLPVVYLDGPHEVVALFGTGNYGRGWRFETALDAVGRVQADRQGRCERSVTITSGSLVAVSAASFLDWWVLRPPNGPRSRTDVFRLAYVAGRWVHVGTVASNLPVWADGRDGVALWALDTHRALAALQGSGSSTLYRTTDGGRVWVPIDLGG